LIVLAGLAAYANTFYGPFIYDDQGSILENPTIRQLWPLWSALSPPCDTRSVTSRPLLNLSLAINYSLGGENVWGYHVTNLVIHLINGLLLLGILRRTFLLPALRSRFGQAATALAFTIALLWTLHPIQTESVTYVIQRAESLAGLFYLLTLYSAIRGSQSSHHAFWYALATVASCLGVGVKEIASTAPLVVLLYDRTFLATSFQKILRRRWALYLGLSASWAFQLCLLARTGRAMLTEEVGTIGMWPYARSQPGVILHYLRLSLWPHPLAFNCEWPVAHTLNDILPGAIVVGALMAVTIWGLMKRRSWGFLGAWFLLILAPTSSIVPLRQLAFEHRMYLSLAAVLTLLVTSVYLLVERLVRRASLHRRAALAAASGLLLLAVIVFGILTVQRNEVYRTELSFWQDAVDKTPYNYFALVNLGCELARHGRLQEAIDHYEQAIQRKPDYAPFYYNFGNVLAKCGRKSEAVARYQEAIRLSPNSVATYNNLGNTLLAMGRSVEAQKQYELVLRIDPANAEAHNNLGDLMLAMDQPVEAIEHFQQAVKTQPNFATACYNLANALSRVGRLTEALEQYQEAIRLKPDYHEAYNNRGSALLRLDRVPDAIQQYQQALRLKPAYAEPHYNLSMIFSRNGRVRDAIEHVREACRLAPNHPQINRFAAWLMATHEPAEGGNPTSAIELAQKACALTERHDASSLDTLAAAYASAGRFDDAIATAKEAWQAAQAAEQGTLAEEIHIRLQLYRDQKPYRDPPRTSSPRRP
jgi:tetratricopeptide (TPR) repeat protein